MAIKLPDPFHQILNIAYKMRGFRIMEAYIDKRDYNNVAYEGTKDLREYLELDDQDSVCDCFCKVSINGEGEKGILLPYVLLFNKNKRIFIKLFLILFFTI